MYKLVLLVTFNPQINHVETLSFTAISLEVLRYKTHVKR